MKSMRIPSRPAPTVEEARLKVNNGPRHVDKKKKPPRPPPPNLSKVKSKSAWNLNQPADTTVSLIEWSPPSSPKGRPFGGSVSSSFSSSTSSLASSKKSFEYDAVPINQNPWNSNVPFPFPTYGLQAKNSIQQQNTRVLPTIIRPVPSKKSPASGSSRGTSPSTGSISPCLDLSLSPPMPSVPPPSPPKIVEETVDPFGIALFDFAATQPGDLQLQENDIVYLTRKVNDEWYYGRVDDREGMFPANFVDVHVPLPSGDVVTALYDFRQQVPEDLSFKQGDKIRVIRRLNDNWLQGECKGRTGQFPSNYVDRLPAHI